jgi:hypothetical protein
MLKLIKNTEDTYKPALIIAVMINLPGGDDDDDAIEGDWDDEDDEVFDDLMADTDDLQLLKDNSLLNSNFDAEDDDHLPDDELQ